MRASRQIQLLGLAAMLASIEIAGATRSSANATAPLDGGPGESRKVTLGSTTSGSQVVVDGGQTPERIPDALAYRHFLSATSLRPNASLNERHVQRLLLERVGFSERDHRTYLATVEWLRERLGDTAPTLVVQQNVNQARQRLSNQLTPEGFHRLDFHVKDHVKRHIKIYASSH